jgi:hypothetical protein
VPGGDAWRHPRGSRQKVAREELVVRFSHI